MTNLHMLVEDRKILIQALAQGGECCVAIAHPQLQACQVRVGVIAQYGVPSARENVLVGSCKLGAVTAQYR